MFWGKLFMFLFAVGAAVCIVLAGVNYKWIVTDYKENGITSLAAVEVAAILYVFFVCGFGFLCFWCDNIILTIIVNN
jgi:hypothetical protein